MGKPQNTFLPGQVLAQREKQKLAAPYIRGRKLGALLLSVAALAIVALRLHHGEATRLSNRTPRTTSGVEPEFDWSHQRVQYSGRPATMATVVLGSSFH
ncbi:hypothetical protein NUW54_g1309 [Trametes sanguinea]|uniref:Uncharacterized protein n=1 Tax=Trametes sanguinea TaxID=158606 RepID=A0ACC1Q854_9APHY|nr:hypothetical protein NUW54_g1309 [Trametes sanguinea]